MKLLIDMNLSPAWIEVFEQHGWSAEHWSTIGAPYAQDREIMTWARENGHVVFTHDLDFGILLAVTQAEGPSVIQVRAQDILPGGLEPLVVPALQQYQEMLESGALMVIDAASVRVRILPLRP